MLLPAPAAIGTEMSFPSVQPKQRASQGACGAGVVGGGDCAGGGVAGSGFFGTGPQTSSESASRHFFRPRAIARRMPARNSMESVDFRHLPDDTDVTPPCPAISYFRYNP